MVFDPGLLLFNFVVELVMEITLPSCENNAAEIYSEERLSALECD